MKTTFATPCLATVLLACVAWGQTPGQPNSPPESTALPSAVHRDASESTAQTADADPSPPELGLEAVPELLRLHLPMLGRNSGVLVRSVTPGTDADRAGLRNGDIILEAGGRPIIEGQPLSQADAALPSVVLRRGRPLVLNPTAPEMRMFDPRFAGGFLGDPRMQPSSVGSVSSASSFAGPGGQAVSISRNGAQLSLEMSIPAFAKNPIRLRGTIAEIERKLQTGPFPEAVKQQVRQALRDTR